MMYKIEIQESLSRFVEVEAECEADALSVVNDMYRNEEIVLDSGDFVEAQIVVKL